MVLVEAAMVSKTLPGCRATPSHILGSLSRLHYPQEHARRTDGPPSDQEVAKKGS